MNKVLNPQILEENLARELQRRKQEDEAKKKEIQKIIDESEEIKQLKQKFQTAQTNKDRLNQMQEKKLRQIRDIQIQSEVENSIFEKRQREMDADLQHRQAMLDCRKNTKKIQEIQIIEKYQQQDESKEQYLKERDQIDQILEKFFQEDQQALDQKIHKRHLCQDAMVQSKLEKAQKIEREKAKEKRENELYLAFIKEKEILANQIKVKKATESAQKEAVFKQLFIEEEKRKQQIEEYENLKNELYQAQYEQNERRKARDEEIKRQNVRDQLQSAEKVAREFKIQQKIEEQKLEKEFRQKMLIQFQQYERQEQLSVQQRRQREEEHKKEVERLWAIRLNIYQQEKNKEMEKDIIQKELETQKQLIILQEKERIIKEYANQYQGFLPKFIFQNQREADMARTK